MQPIRKLLIWTAFISLLLLAEGFKADAVACDYYASPTGTGNGTSASSPFRIANFWSVAGPGKTLCLLDGVYTGSDSTITPPRDLGGTSANPIRIRALNDGSVRINGQGARIPINLGNNNDWFVIEGMDAHNSGASSTSHVVRITNGSDNNIIRRVVAWDCPVNGNCNVFGVHGGINNAFEDVAGFGTGRKIFSMSQGGHSNAIFRRAWGAWTRTTNTVNNPKMTFTIAYRNYNGLCENCVGTWREEGTGIPTIYKNGIFTTDHFQNSADRCANARYLGSIAYRRASDPLASNYFGQLWNRVNCVTYEHVVAYDEEFNAARIVSLPNTYQEDGNIPGSKIINRNTWIGGNTPSINAEWVVTNTVTAKAVGAAPNIWNGTGNQGARVCKRYLNGQLTDQPLWPWPMDARINAALKASGRNPANYFRGPGNTVTSEMETIFGTIPAVCKGTSAPASQTTPSTPSATAPSTPDALVATPGG